MKIHIGLLAQKFVMSRTDGEPALDLGVNLRSASDIVLKPASSARA
jgi:hypothetical protein